MPYTFEPLLKPTLWGGSRLAALKGRPSGGAPVGESWEISGVEGSESVVASPADEAGLTLPQLIARHGERLMGRRAIKRYGERFPLLVKFIDASQDLSLQVHPDDELASRLHNGSNGKTELWYIVHAEPGARIWLGFNRQLTCNEFFDMVADGCAMQAVASCESKPGDVYFLPPGRVHLIGGGNFLAEIQQTSDITYRIFDHNRLQPDGTPRALHLESAREAIDFSAMGPDLRKAYDTDSPGPAELARCPHFKVERLMLDGNAPVTLDRRQADSFLIVMCVDGEATVEGLTLKAGTTALVEAWRPEVALQGRATLLLASI